MRIDVSPAGYDAASRVFGRDLHDGLYATLLTLGTALSGTTAMAGSDPVGVSWATEYDGAAGSAIDTIAQLCSASRTLARMLERSGFNHGVAEWASDPAHAALRPADTVHYPAETDLSCLESLPSASGGSASPPHGWGTIAHAVGRIWPNGHPGSMRTAAQAWTDAADGIDGQGGLITQAQISILEQRSPEVQDAWTVCDNVGKHLADTASTCRSLAAACTELADHIEQAHHDVEEQIREFLIWSAAIEGAGAVLCIVSVGIAEGAAQVAEAVRIVETGKAIAAIIDTLATAARAVTATIRGLRASLAAIGERLLIIADARIATLTYRMAGLGPEFAGEASALVRLDKAAAEEAKVLKAEANASRDIPGVGKVTAHGAERVAGQGATRGGCLTPAQIRRARAEGAVFRQNNGAVARVYERSDGRFEVVIDGTDRMISSLGPISARKLAGLARNYGWKP